MHGQIGMIRPDIRDSTARRYQRRHSSKPRIQLHATASFTSITLVPTADLIFLLFGACCPFARNKKSCLDKDSSYLAKWLLE